MTQFQTISTAVLLTNLFAFLLFWFDKRQAIKSKNRISEFRLLWITFMCGTIGAVLAMTLFRHKTSKISFLIKFVAAVIVQIAAIAFWLLKE